MVQVTLLADQQPATVMITGIQAPSMGRRPPPPEGSSQDALPLEPVPDPYAREAKHFTEVSTSCSSPLQMILGWIMCQIENVQLTA